MFEKQYFYTCTKHDPKLHVVSSWFPSFVSHRFFPATEVVLPSHPKWVLQSSTVTPSRSSSRMSDVQMATAAKHKTNATCYKTLFQEKTRLVSFAYVEGEGEGAYSGGVKLMIVSDS